MRLYVDNWYQQVIKRAIRGQNWVTKAFPVKPTVASLKATTQYSTTMVTTCPSCDCQKYNCIKLCIHHVLNNDVAWAPFCMASQIAGLLAQQLAQAKETNKDQHNCTFMRGIRQRPGGFALHKGINSPYKGELMRKPTPMHSEQRAANILTRG